MPDTATHKSDLLSDYLSREELAEELGVTVRTIANWQHFRVGPPFCRVGQRVLFLRADVADWIKSTKTEPLGYKAR
ncbi:helix-turn-helix transcriptional regulator [Oceanibacterium hippocampi]|uniref:Helix-turn-helix domain protein n=1 Tax=Oceanibacterium hippocampi TaxID=745714 RepID=A0A1Y5TZ76_9PROT|nr:helix-turn-helix domain-containing protein [Oceanibacterium hippocampi]SLN77381.1 Helix-turn-helix domain protein [Oceanibacterium hippocampi]